MKADLKSMTRKELEKLRDDVDKALTRVKDKEMDMARSAAEKAAAAHGFSLSDLTGAQPAAKKRGRKPGAAKAAPKAKAPAKFRNPSDHSQTWSGRGRKPAWYKDGEAAGRPLSDFAI